MIIILPNIPKEIYKNVRCPRLTNMLRICPPHFQGRVRFDKEEVLWWRLVRGRRKCHYQGGSVSFIIVLGNARRGVIIIVIADRAVGGRSKQVY